MTRGKIDQRVKIKQMEKNYTKTVDHVRKRLNWFKLFYKSWFVLYKDGMY